MPIQGFGVLLAFLLAPLHATESGSSSYRNLRLYQDEGTPAAAVEVSPPRPETKRFSTTLRYAPVASFAVPRSAPSRPASDGRRLQPPPRGAVYPPPAPLGGLVRLYAAGALVLIAGAAWAAWLSRRRSARDAEVMRLVAHELKSPLSAIESYVSLLEHEGGGDAAQQARGWLEDLGRVKTTAAHLRGTITDLLEMTKLESGRLALARRPADLGRLAAEAAALYGPQAREAGLSLAVSSPGRPLAASCDADRVRQVLHNLLSNAIKFSRPGGAVRLEVEEHDGGDALRVTVADEGLGIAREDQARLFGKFVRLHPSESGREGTGLGLYIARSIVEAHGGRIWAESAPGVGSRFNFTIPKGGS